ncbi:MAG: ATP-binding protein [Deltaproteobacteria bacterium]|nr:ATP-binding protein [Deltaproteobacteria bacterium]
MSAPPLSHWLPYWATRTIEVAGQPLAILVLVDGTVAVGLASSGADVFAADNARLNRCATALRRALNALPPDAFLQCEWHTGLPWDDVIDAYEARRPRAAAKETARLLAEQRRARAAALRGDAALTRGRLVYFVGLSRALGLLGGHRAGLLSRLLSRAKDPQLVTPADLERAAERVADIAARVRDELASTGALLTPLDEPALLAELHRAINPASSQACALHVVDRPEELPEALTRQGALLVHRPLTLREQLPLGDLAWTEGCFTLDDPPLPHRALTLERLPALTRPDFMMGVQFRTPARLRLVSTFVATDRERLTERLIRKRNVAHAQAGGVVRDVAANVAFSEYERVLETMLTNDQRVFAASVTVILDAPDHASLDAATRELKDAFNDVGAALTTETGRQLQAFLGALPGNGARAPRVHQVITNNAADLMPYFAPSEGDDEAQLLYHTRQATLRRLSLRPSQARSNNNALVFGSSGSGKSFNVSCIFEQACLVEDGPLLIIDVQGPELSSYRVLAEALGGSYTALASDADVAFNPFFPHAEIELVSDGGGAALDDEAVRYLADLVALVSAPDLPARADRALIKEIARRAVTGAYAATRATRRTPILGDVADALAAFQATEPEYEPLARAMLLTLRAWLADPTRARLINRPTRFEGARQMQVFDLYGLERDRELATVLLLSVSFHIWATLRRYPREVTKFVVFDECWKFLLDETASGIVAELFRTGRKWNASTWAITQSLADFLASPIHAAVMQNAALALLFQHAGDHERVSSLLELNARQHALFKQLRFKKGAYAELLLVERAAGEASVLRLRPTAFDLWLNTTDPADVGFRERVRRERGLSLLDAVRHCAKHHPNGAPRARTPNDEGARP